MENKQAPFSWNEIIAMRNDENFQGQHEENKAKERYLKVASPCPECKTAAKDLAWFYFTSSERDWESLAGSAGWMTVCDKCKIQVDFFLEIMS